MQIQHNYLSSILIRAVFETTRLCDCCQELASGISGDRSDGIFRFNSEVLQKLIADRIRYNEFDRINHINTYIAKIRSSTYIAENSRNDEISFFDIVRDFADTLITRAGGRYCFRYGFTDIWINTVRSIGEEIFVSSKAVLDDLRCNCNKPRMDWQYCIEHDNFAIKKMLARDRGVSENHFHLRSSSPYFDISWIYLVNNVESVHYRRSVESIQSKLLNPEPNYINDYSLVTVWRKAAALRKILYNIIEENDFEECDDRKKNDPSANKAHRSQSEENDENNTEENADKKKNNSSSSKNYSSPYQFANRILSCENCDTETGFVIEIQKYIASYLNNGRIDYAGREPLSESHIDFVSGERYIFYNCLKKIILREEDYQRVGAYFFIYLMMKHRFYREMVQSNKRIGFHNFNEYQDRKGLFIPWEAEKNVAIETIYSVLESTKMHGFEMRIYPAEDVKTLSEDLRLYKGAVKEAIDQIKDEDLKKQYSKHPPCFFTLHFIKDTPRECELKKCDYCALRNRPRHSDLRDRLKNQTNAIMSLNERFFKDVKGIDAAGEEIKCRPEVFAVYFRRLLHYFRPDPKGFEHFQLRATYHAGEDNYDLVDGIRAIFEALFFLDLRSGSRIGHATLLGNSPYQYYNKNRNPVAIPAQIFLDNIVWMYYFIKENAIVFEESALLIEFIKHNFNLYFNKVFGKALGSTNDIFASNNSDSSSGSGYEMNDYYLSYLLRGDDPELYHDPDFFLSDAFPALSFADGYRICQTHVKMNEARRSPRARYLYHLYQYNCEVKKAGEEPIYDKLPAYYIKAVDLIQQEMRRKLTYRDIGIETNPSSNRLISNFENMEDHPITVFYDDMLLNDSSRVQMNVSINTDDKSIFSTSLTNEYAYLEFYLEHKKKDGKYAYSRYNILQWLNSIRIMGNEQSFIDS